MRFSPREDFWIIVAARSKDETEIRAGKAAGGRTIVSRIRNQPTRRREPKIQCFKSTRSAQKFLSTHAVVYNTSTSNAISYQLNRTACYAPPRGARSSRPFEVPHSNPASRRRFDNVITLSKGHASIR
jgi:hypothetical protein